MLVKNTFVTEIFLSHLTKLLLKILEKRNHSVKNNIFHTQDLCMRTPDTNLICKKVCRSEDYYEEKDKKGN